MKLFDILSKPFVANLTAFISGILLTLDFAPFNLSPLALISLMTLIALWYSATPRQALARGWLFGLGWFGSGVSWVFVSVHHFGNTNTPLAALITLLMVSILALYPALNGYILNRLFPHNNPSKWLLAFPSSWVLFEWLRSHLFSGFPWLLLGFSQIQTPLKGFAPLFAVYGVSFAVLITAVLLASLVIYRSVRAQSTVILSTVCIWLLGGLLTQISWTHPVGKPITVSLVQGNVPIEEKWNPENALKNIEKYKTLTAKHWSSRLIVWPEAAITLDQQQARAALMQLGVTAKQHNSTLITGIPIVDGKEYYNGMLALGAHRAEYRKHHLVPFGEYTPLDWAFSNIMQWFQIPLSDLSSQPLKQPDFKLGDITIAPFICYEIAFTEQVLHYMPNTQLILTIIDDGWFGKSIAADQHLEISQMQALTTGRFLVQASNRGITAIINPKGLVIQDLPEYETGVLTGRVLAMAGVTPVAAYGLYPGFGICLALLLFALFMQRKERY